MCSAIDDVDATLAGSTALAETCLQSALDALEAEFAQRFGMVRAADGTAQRLVVFGLGKLGGGELNFSSDVDLVYAYPQDGESDGPRALAAEDYFARLGQQLAKLLDEATADGFCHRVDLRLRPFGNAGRVALPFAAMESVLPARRPRLGALCLAEGATGRRRQRGRRTLPADACGRSSIGVTSTTARSTACAK